MINAFHDYSDQDVWMSPKKDAMDGVPTELSALSALPCTPSPLFAERVTQSTEWFDGFKEEEQTWVVRMLLSRMHHHQHGSVNSYLKPMLQRDFISLLPKKGLDHVAEAILSFLDAKSLCAAELVCQQWQRVISDGMLWKKLIERKVHTDSLWRGLAERRGWISTLFKPRPGENHPNHSFYRKLYPTIIKDIEAIENNWRCGKHNLQRINCRSENSKGVYCLQYDDQKIVSGLRDNTIKMWDRNTLACQRVLTGHTGSVLCLQYDERVIISGSSDSTVRVWDVATGDHITTLIHHCEAVLHLRYLSLFLGARQSKNSICGFPYNLFCKMCKTAKSSASFLLFLVAVAGIVFSNSLQNPNFSTTSQYKSNESLSGK